MYKRKKTEQRSLSKNVFVVKQTGPIHVDTDLCHVSTIDKRFFSNTSGHEENSQVITNVGCVERESHTENIGIRRSDRSRPCYGPQLTK